MIQQIVAGANRMVNESVPIADARLRTVPESMWCSIQWPSTVRW